MSPPELTPGVRSSPVVREIEAALAQVRDGSYAGRDPGQSVLVEIDGSGLVTAVRLIPAITRQQPETIARAVRLAYADASAHRTQALRDAVRWLLPAEPQ